MEQIFVSRASAIQRLLERRRNLMSEIGYNPSLVCSIGDVEQLLLDVRAGRLNVFQFTDDMGQICRIFIL
ncbi:MAG TPA: hypothetical protein VJU59_41945 [Paraburkholderia sp.]|uniref:hypothetical protein n=1 Tax=Paraburkholderia sp. TaxID=1926495 RepID=UPI002B47B3B8|nr:hypothetical protein [Paraburkholderia sp.]HKR46157.1 hypothetical protein [Paraburkholderia sp.]